MAIGGKNTFWAHGSSGAPSTNVNYSTNTRAITPTFDGEEVDATVFGDAFRDFEQSFKNANINATYKFAPAIWQIIADLYSNGTEITFELGPNGTTTTFPKITGSMVLINFNQAVAIGGLLEITATFRVTGAPVFGAY